MQFRSNINYNLLANTKIAINSLNMEATQQSKIQGCV